MCNGVCVCIGWVGWGGGGGEGACVGLGVSTLTLKITCLGLLELMSLSSEQVSSPLDVTNFRIFLFQKETIKNVLK